MQSLKNRLKISFIYLVIIIVIILIITPSVAFAQKRKHPTLIRDTEIENILKQWAKPIFEAANLNPDNVNIILVQSDVMNAFVAGGPNIFIYTDLILKTENPGELLGVIAHETGHIAGGHLIRSRTAMERASYESIIGTILGLGAAIVSGDPRAVSALSAGGSSIAQRRYLAHSRIQETSADQAALRFFEKAKINPRGLETFMDKLRSQTYMPENQQSEYIRTHPLVDNRIKALHRRVEQSEYKNQPFNAKIIEQHARMKAKLIGFINPGKIPWVYDDNDISIAAKYARTIGAYRDNKVKEALSRINKLLEIEPENPYFLELKGQMLVEFGKVNESLPYYRKASNLLPKDPLLRIALAHALIESTQKNDSKVLNEAIEHLEYALRYEPRSTRIHRLMATAYGRLGKNSKAQIHLAEEAVLQRRFSYAKQHANAILAKEPEGSKIWLEAKDIVSFIKTIKNR